MCCWSAKFLFNEQLTFLTSNSVHSNYLKYAGNCFISPCQILMVTNRACWPHLFFAPLRENRPDSHSLCFFFFLDTELSSLELSPHFSLQSIVGFPPAPLKPTCTYTLLSRITLSRFNLLGNNRDETILGLEKLQRSSSDIMWCILYIYCQIDRLLLNVSSAPLKSTVIFLPQARSPTLHAIFPASDRFPIDM